MVEGVKAERYMKTALLNRPSAALENCELTFIDRGAIQVKTALYQHGMYEAALRKLGVQVEVLEVNQTSPDGVFVEDVAIVLDEIAIVTSMGSAVRRSEIEAVGEVVKRFRKDVRQIALPATIEGGDVLRVGKTLYVGDTCRTNREGIQALADIVRLFGYDVVPVRVHGCLHLKTGITALDDATFICHAKWFDTEPFSGNRLIEVAADEPWAANVLRVGDALIVNAASPRTAEKIEALHYKTERVDISEFGKAEAGLTCMSLIFEGAI